MDISLEGLVKLERLVLLFEELSFSDIGEEHFLGEFFVIESGLQNKL
jgi:hypothetical protein